MTDVSELSIQVVGSIYPGPHGLPNHDLCDAGFMCLSFSQ